MVVEPFSTWPSSTKPARTAVDPSDRKFYLMGADKPGGKAALNSFDNSLKTQHSNNTRDAQRQLNEIGYDTGGIDGVSGPKTDQAIRAFQAANGLKVDGIVGPKTQAALAAARSGGSPAPGPSVTHYDPAATHPAFSDQPIVPDVLGPTPSVNEGAKGEDPTRPVSVFNPPASEAASTPRASAPTLYQLNDPAAAAGFVAGSGAGNLVNESIGLSSPFDPIINFGPPRQTERTADEVASDYFGPTDRAVTRSEALDIIKRDFADFDGALKGRTDGFIGRDDFAKVLTEPGYTDEQRAAAAYFYANPGQFNSLDDAENARVAPNGLIGEGDVNAARADIEAKRIDGSSDSVQPNVDGSDRRLYIQASEAADDPTILERYDARTSAVNEDDVVDVLGYDYEVFSGPDGKGISVNDLRDIVLDDTGTYTDEHKAVAAHLLANRDTLNSLDGNSDGIIGDKNITAAGGRIGPTLEQRISAQKAALEGLEGQGGVDSETVSQAISVLDAAQGTLTPAEYAQVSNYLNKAALGGQAAIAIQSALTGDYDEALEQTFDAAVVIAVKQILTKIAPRLATGAAGGPVGIGVSALSLLLAFAPLDTSETRQPAPSELSGEINERGQHVQPGAHGTRLQEVMNSQIPAG